ncbi:ornithine decarboxylase [Halteromyces radiatus]|uniref:ornithine decarboxylase n=1 Tax=Halteromyces radiatus TaxID=101107 RepID=UPI00221F516B|nr:ornithine decarboxylase [Halteromyces radiatus]KAI8098967.1 ornithine decarboxylase [Halteromyces radiatus]
MIPQLETAVFGQQPGFNIGGPPIKDTIGDTNVPMIHNLSVHDTAKQKLDSHSRVKWETDQENAFFVANLGEVYRQHIRWNSLLPRIEPHFAIKSNPDPMVAKLLASLGVGFDCASKAEIQQVLDMGVEPSRIIYANPCKQASYIRYVAQQNVAKMTFDNAEELHKIKMIYPNAELVLRILTDDSKSDCQLGLKFGAPLETVDHLLRTAKELSLNVIGVSFHVGSGCHDENAFADAVLRARTVFDQAEALGFHFTLLDVGGGFPGADIKDGITFEKVAAVLGPAVDELFSPDIRVIAEPGRYYVASAFTLCTHIIGRRTVMKGSEDPSYMYYVNDGMYGAFNCILFDHQVVVPHVLSKNGRYVYGQKLNETEYECSIWGPTCDSIDCLNKSTRLPLLEEGDWLYYENMGAYTICAASQFNGFQKSKVIYTNTSC